MKKLTAAPHVLGLDIGSNSIGWAILDFDGKKATKIIDAGVRVFEAGLEGDVMAGRGTSRNIARRNARSTRRRLNRLTRRLNVLFHLLQGAGLLPESENDNSDDRWSSHERHRVLTQLNDELSHTWRGRLTSKGIPADVANRIAHTLPYFLRARALDEKLDPYELGRVLYHLGERRGFLSNRKKPEGKDEGVVKKSIGELAHKMVEIRARTLGEYFASLDPEQERIRNQYTSRPMYEHEFEAIWTAQQAYHPDVLRPQLRHDIHRAIFYQRPLRWDRDTIGDCDLEPGRKRAPLALLIVQRFRLLDKVNNLLIETADGRTRMLTPEERETLIDALETKGDRTFRQIRKLLALSEEDGFNLEGGGEKKLPGNRTAARLIKIFRRKRWDALSETERDHIVEDLRSIEKPGTLKRRGLKAWKLDEEQAQAFSGLTLESDYSSLSRQAIVKVLPQMEEGVPFPTVRKDVYGTPPTAAPVAALPRLEKALPTLRNPVVARALTELRRVVNNIVRKHGTPSVIRVELARELRKNKKQRALASKRNRDNQKQRADAAARICKEMGIQEPSRNDILKVILAEECGWTCPYTGKRISMQALLGDHPQFDIEHIIPFSRCLDNSYMNKTLCEVRENRAVKKNRTPYEAYGPDPKHWTQIIERVRGFRGRGGRVKLQRFMLTDIESISDFTSQQMNDTRYASRLATQYLGMLYGGVIDSGSKRRIQVNRGATTAFFREAWDLNPILGDGGQKSRDDHRHHAVDAIVISLAGPKQVKMLSDAAQRAEETFQRRRFRNPKPPWDSFLDDAAAAIDRIVVSHRVRRKVSGRLHEDTLYGPPWKGPDGKNYVRVRKPLEKLTAKMVNHIVDPTVRRLVKEKLAQIGGEPKQVFSKGENYPVLKTRDGREIPVRSVRIRIAESASQIGSGHHRRYVTKAPGTNHHVEILRTTDKRGRTRWEGKTVTLLEAIQRLRSGKPVVKRDHGSDKEFLFSLGADDMIRIKEPDDRPGLYRIRVISDYESGVKFDYVSIKEARKKDEISKAGDWFRKSPNQLREMKCRKVTVSPLGEIRQAND